MATRHSFGSVSTMAEGGRASPRILFLALDTWSSIGGLQRFDQRVISALAAFAKEARRPPPRMHVLRDVKTDLPADLAADLIGFGADRAGFVRASLSAARNADLLLLGQLNLLPVGWLAKKLNPRLKLMLFVHGIEAWNAPAYRPKRFYEPLLLSSVDRIASVSRYTATIMAREFKVPEEKFTILPNAVDGLRDFGEKPAAEPVLLCVTRMAPHDHGKHVDSVLRAFALVREQLGDSRLEIVGDGALRQGLERLAVSLGISDSVSFLGRVSDRELEACYRRARAFVLPSSKEGFGIVYLEAWKHGLPVICGDKGASHEIVSHGQDGFVADPENIESLAKYMKTLLIDILQGEAMAARGMEKLTSTYLDEHFRLNLKGILEELH